MAGLTRRRLLHGLAASAAAGALVRPAHGQNPPPAASLSDVGDAPRAAMAGAALALLGALPAETRRHAVFALEDKERLDWHYIPRRRAGVPFKDMPAAGRAAAHELMKASLSAVGYGKAVGIIRLEEVLRRLETFGLMRDPDNYAFTVFGNPGPSTAWGWRVEGHHLSLNFTLVPGPPSSAPIRQRFPRVPRRAGALSPPSRTWVGRSRGASATRSAPAASSRPSRSATSSAAPAAQTASRRPPASPSPT